MKRVMIGLLLAAGVCAAADDEAGKKALRTQCVACHSLRLVESQRLSAAAWGKEIDKMVGWGAVVLDRAMLIDYLASEYSNTKPVPKPDMSR